MNRAKNAITCVLLASLVALVVYVILLVRRATAVVSALPATIQTVIREQGQATRDAALSAITDTRREALAEISRTRGDLLARVESGLPDLTPFSANLLAGPVELPAGACATRTAFAGLVKQARPIEAMEASH